MAASAPMPEVKAAAYAPAGPVSLEEGGSIESGSIERQLAETMFDESQTFARAARPSAPHCRIADTSISEKASFATDEYEPIEEKDSVSVLHGQTSTFRMTTNTASAGIVLNQLRNGRRIDRNMVRIEEMLNYFRYSTPMPGKETFGISLESGYKYSRIVTTGSEETGTVRVRYKEPPGEVSLLQEKVIGPDLDSFSDSLRLAFIVYVCSEKMRDSHKISENEIAVAKKFYGGLGEEIRRMNEADLYKLAGILEMSKRELGIGIGSKRPFKW